MLNSFFPRVMLISILSAALLLSSCSYAKTDKQGIQPEPTLPVQYELIEEESAVLPEGTDPEEMSDSDTELQSSSNNTAKEILITEDNWQDYFEIRKDVFGESSSETGKLCYLCEIMYVTFKDEYSEAVSIDDFFSVTFSFKFNHVLMYALVDEAAHTFNENTLCENYGEETCSCILDNESYSRIKNNDYVWSDGFGHTSLRDQAQYRRIWYYDTAHDIELVSVSGSIFLYE